MIWAVSAMVLFFCLVPVGIVTLRGPLVDRLVALEMAGIVISQLCVLWAVAEKRPSFVDVGLAVGVLSFGGGLVFARFLERWL